jgi:hypothetical protein
MKVLVACEFSGIVRDAFISRGHEVLSCDLIETESRGPHYQGDIFDSIMSSLWRKPDQIVQPWMFGHGETKATCLWLENLPMLQSTEVVDGRENRIHRMPPSPDRGKLRSATYPGIAKAMATQWG